MLSLAMDFAFSLLPMRGGTSPNFSWISVRLRISNVVAGFSPRSARLLDTVFRKRTRAEGAVAQMVGVANLPLLRSGVPRSGLSFSLLRLPKFQGWVVRLVRLPLIRSQIQPDVMFWRIRVSPESRNGSRIHEQCS